MRARRERPVTNLADLVDSYQASGRYVLRRTEAIRALGVSEEALKKSVQRLVGKRRLAVPRRAFLVIVPMEYRHAGAPPPSWFIDALMRYHDQKYYVGLLSAAALHGAAHQQPQEFQVVTEGQLPPVIAGRARIRFFVKRGVERTPTMEVRTETGSMRVSTPEATALDLIRYVRSAGHLGNVVDVLGELAERLDAARLVEAARLEGEVPSAQRLGYLLDRVGAVKLTTALASYVDEHRPRFTRLRPDRPAHGAEKDERWRVSVNENVEAET